MRIIIEKGIFSQFLMILPFVLIFSIVYFRYFVIPKNPTVCWVVNRVPLEFFFYFFFLLNSIILNMDVALACWQDPDPGYSTNPYDYIQPQVNEEEGVPPIPPDIPVLEQPLIHDELRRVQLSSRLGPHSIVREFNLRTLVDIVYQQAEVEKKIEAALVLDGIPAMRVLTELNRLRGVLFYPRGTPLSPATLARYIQQIAQSGTRQSIPYRRVIRAIQNYELFIDLIFFFNNNNQNNNNQNNNNQNNNNQ
jgi:hypothetical protein